MDLLSGFPGLVWSDAFLLCFVVCFKFLEALQLLIDQRTVGSGN